MASPVRPPNGVHVFHMTDQNGNTTHVSYRFTDAGMETSFGTLPWEAGPPGHFELGSIGMTPYDDGSAVAVNGSVSYAGSWQ